MASMHEVQFRNEVMDGRRRQVLAGLAALASLPLAACGGGGGGGSGRSDGGDWRVTGELLAERGSPVALTLRDGRVLVMGSRGNSQSHVDPELYEPATGRAITAGSWSGPRSGFTATHLPDGRVLVVGGFDESQSRFLTSALLFDPAGLAWTEAAPLAHARASHTATLLPDGRVLVVGGSVGLTEFAPQEIYDPASNTWAAGPSMEKPRRGHTATLLRDGRVLVCGGTDTGDGGTSSMLVGSRRVELFDYRTGAWSIAAPLPHVGRFGHTATLLANGRVLVAGGCPEDDVPYQFLDDSHIFDAVSGTWTESGRMGVGRMRHRAVLLSDGRVLVGAGDTWETLRTYAPETFDPRTGTWAFTNPMVHPRVDFEIVSLPENRALAFSGGDAGRGFRSVEMLSNL
jgi:hypothetical protein